MTRFVNLVGTDSKRCLEVRMSKQGAVLVELRTDDASSERQFRCGKTPERDGLRGGEKVRNLRTFQMVAKSLSFPSGRKKRFRTFLFHFVALLVVTTIDHTPETSSTRHNPRSSTIKRTFHSTILSSRGT
jgi:hypothetical protein